MPRRLTDLQVRVLAAVDRRGICTLPDLWDDFPDRPPSATLRVLEALYARGLVEASGDPAQIYLGGVTFTTHPSVGIRG